MNIIPPIDPVPAAPLEPILHTRSGRQQRVPKRHADFVPSSLKEIPSHMQEYWKAKMNFAPAHHPPSPIPPPPQENESTPPESNTEASSIFSDEPEPIPEYFDMGPNKFGVFRRYTTLPQRDPEAGTSPDLLIDSSAIAKTSTNSESPEYAPSMCCFGMEIARGKRDKIIAPFLNISIFRIMHWFYSSSGLKTIFDLEALIRDVIIPDEFDKEHFRSFSAHKVLDSLDNHDPTSETLTAKDGWQLASVKIPVPKEGHKYPEGETNALTYKVQGLYYRKPLQIIIAGYEDPIMGKQLHHIPHREYVKRPSAGVLCLFHLFYLY